MHSSWRRTLREKPRWPRRLPPTDKAETVEARIASLHAELKITINKEGTSGLGEASSAPRFVSYVESH
jgi:hypothetical protein